MHVNPKRKRKCYLKPGANFTVPRSTLFYQRVQGSSNPGTNLSCERSPTVEPANSPPHLDDSVQPDYNCLPAEVDDVAENTRNDDRSRRSPQHIVNDRASEEPTGSAHADAGSESNCVDTADGEDDFMKLFSGERLPNCDLSVADAMVTLMAYST